MKKARVVEIPSEPLTYEDKEDLLSHAFNSAIWYVTNYPRTTLVLKEKLYAKGYPKHEVSFIDHDGNVKTVNFVEETVDKIVDSHLLDDNNYAERVIESLYLKGKGINQIKFELYRKKVPQNVIEDVLEKFDDDNNDKFIVEGIEKALSKIKRSSAYMKKESAHEKHFLLMNKLRERGFSSSEIEIWQFHVDYDGH